MFPSLLGMMAGTAQSLLAEFSFSNNNVFDTVVDPTDANTKIVFNTDGTVDEIEGATSTEIGTWHPGTPVGAEWEIGYTGTPTDAYTESSAASDAYAVMTTTRQWGYDRTTVGTYQSGVITFRVKQVGGSIIDTCTINMNATVDV